MFDSSYTQTLQDQIGQLSKLLGGQGTQAALPAQPAANQYDYVTGIEGARAYQQKLLAGAKHIVWDNEQAKFYILQKDANGNPGRIMIGTFELTPEPTMEERYVTKDDFNALVARLDQLINKEVKTDG